MERTLPAHDLVRDLLAAPDATRRERVRQELASSSGDDLDALLSALKDVSEQNLGVDTATALDLADLLVDGAQRSNRPNFLTLGLLARADALRAQGDVRAAVQAYERAGALARKLRDGATWARTRTGWILAMHYLGRGREALGIVDEALHVLLEHGEFLRAGGLSLNAGLVCHELGEYRRALRLYERAQELYERAADANPSLRALAEERTAKARANMALDQSLLGDFDQAIQLYEAARDVFLQHDEQQAALRVEHYIAAVYAGQGQLTRALRVHSQALAAAERAGLADTVVEVALEMIRCYQGLNRHAEGLELAERLVVRCESSASPTEAAKARLASAQCLAALGRVDAALAQLGQAAATFAASGQSVDLAETELLRARLHLAEHDWGASSSSAEGALASFVERGLTVPRAQAELVLAHAELELHHPTEAAAHVQVALDLTRERNLLPLSHQAHHVLGRVADSVGDTAAALTEYEAAVVDLERVQSSLATELRVEFLGDKLALFHDAMDAALRAGDPARAFAYLERAKSRALVDYLTSSAEVHVRADDPVEQALLDELAALRDEHHWFYSRLHGLGVDADGVSDVERDKLRAAVVDRERRIAVLVERLALVRDAEGLEAVGSPSSTTSFSLPDVPAGSVLLEYVLRDDHGLVFVVTPRGLDVVRLAAGSRQVRRLLGRWQLNLDAVADAVAHGEPVERLVPNARGVLRALYEALIEPVAERLAGAERLVVVPYGPTHGVPFHALFDGQRYLVEYLQVATSPSSALLTLSERRPAARGRGALVVGHSLGGRLPAALAEAEAVAGLLQDSVCLLDGQATRAAVVAEAPRHDVVHLAAHGEARLDNPFFAHIDLADGELSMVDIFNLRLDGALVTLSACETGRGAVLGGDELVGLSRGFLFAGAATLVQSLWRVDDNATASLMRQFYRELVDGQSPGAALRQAQCALLERGLHPHLWAAFQVVGRDHHRT